MIRKEGRGRAVGGRNDNIFHSNIIGRLRANSERHDQVCFEASEHGEFLSSSVVLEFTVQYQSILHGNFRAEHRRPNALQ